RAEADFLEQHLGVSPGARLLDVPCGDGRLAFDLARRGYRLTGVDISEEFLAAAQEEGRSRGLEVELRRGDMRDLPWAAEFDGAFCGGSSFWFLGDSGDAAFVAAVARTLKPRSRFIIDSVKAAEVVLPHFRETWEMEVGGVRMVAQNRYDHVSGWM